MKDWPNPAWAALFMVMAVVLAIIALLCSPRSQMQITMAVLAIASNIISGSFGYINGHKDGAASVSIPSQPSPGSSTVVNLGSPITPVEPAQPAK